MSNIQGYTFSSQPVSPEADGRLYEYLLEDGRLFGGAITYNGTDIYIAAGTLISKGRVMRVPSTITLATASTHADGYCRIIVKIDLSEVATETEFEQADFRLEYSATDSWSELTQQDINDGTSAVYEIEYAVVKLLNYTVDSLVRILDFSDLAESGRPQLYYVSLLAADWYTELPDNNDEFWHCCDVSVDGLSSTEHEVIAFPADAASGAWLEEHGFYELAVDTGRFTLRGDELPEADTTLQLLYEIKKKGE
ncbi:MAG: hypothetical protein Q4B42_00900 [Oscillospiraceae bacterium]|nr:hypothetical protein [Oscillospiraceae bacterium]